MYIRTQRTLAVGVSEISHESTVVFLLKKMMYDKYDYIEYFIYELDYGREYEIGMVEDEHGQDIDIHTSDLLYDFLAQNIHDFRDEMD